VVNLGIFPVIVFGIVTLLKKSNYFDQYVLEGLIIMGAVPTTISSCNILTQIAGG